VLPPSAINEGPPVEPRPSATVLLVREADPWELLMVQRPGGADFAPGAYVFPGGTVIEADRSFRDELRAAAVRELFEEVGILLARGATEAHREALRGLTGAGESFDEALTAVGLEPDFGALFLIARWVTPVLLRRRYDARFYVAKVPPQQTVLPQEGEVVAWRWVSPAQALADPEITLVYATRSVLESVADAPDVESLLERCRGRDEVPAVEPRIIRTESGWEVVRE